MSKRTHKFDYPHPLIKNLYHNKSYTSQNASQLIKQKPSFYDNNYTFSPLIKNMISPKLLRLSNSKIIPQQKFGILMQPFCSNQQVQYIHRSALNKQSYKCSLCKSLLNYQSESVSLYQVKCKVCENINSINLDVKNTLENVGCCYDISNKDLDQNKQIQKSLQKNICFVIEASQFNYHYRVHQVIKSVLTSLASTCYSKDQNLQRKLSLANTEDQQASADQYNEYNNEQKNQQNVKYKVSFVLFNDCNIFVINQTTQDIMVFNQSFIMSSKNQSINNKSSVINEQDFFRPIQQITLQTYDLIGQIMYQSYLKNTSCLNVVSQFIHQWLDNYFINTRQSQINANSNQNQNNEYKNKDKKEVQYKFFINSLKFTKSIFTDKQQPKLSIPQSINQLNNTTRQLFTNVSNLVSNKINSTINNSNKNKTIKNNSNADTNQQNSQTLKLYSNYSFFYLPHYHTSTFHTVTQKQVISKLNNNLYKMYPNTQNQTAKNQMNLFNEMYYDLYENISTQSYYNIKINIITSEKVQILGVGNKCIGYNDCQQQLIKTHSSQQTGKKFNSYSITLNSLQSNSTLPIDVKIIANNNTLKNNKQKSNQTKHFIQIHIQYQKQYLINHTQTQIQTYTRVFHTEVASLNRAINYHHHIYASLSTYVDDQTLFYFHLRWILSQCHKTKTNHTIFKKLYQVIQRISDQFKDQYGQIDFHKQYVNIFMYAFMICNKPIMNGINDQFYYHRHKWLKGSFQFISKYIYPRTYQIFKNKQTNQNQETHKLQLKNIKSSPKNFKSNSIVLLDNSQYLYFIIGEDINVSQLKNIFGTCFINQIQQMQQLPQLQTNIQYRQLIDLARSQHQTKFLPLKIIQLFSSQFDNNIAHLLYIKDNHFKYMRQLWEMEPKNKKLR